MEPKLSITVRNISAIDTVDEFIRMRLSELTAAKAGIIECRAYVEKTDKFRMSGNPYLIRIAITLPDSPDIVVKREPSGIVMRDPLYTSISNAFVAVKRMLVERSNTNRQNGFRLQSEYGAVVSQLFPDKGCGFLRTDSGKSVFFHRNSVVGDEFDVMEEGMGVWFIERESESGSWASTVRICTSAS